MPFRDSMPLGRGAGSGNNVLGFAVPYAVFAVLSIAKKSGDIAPAKLLAQVLSRSVLCGAIIKVSV